MADGLLQKLKSECARTAKVAFHLDEVISLFQTIPRARVQKKLPADTHWGVLHPDSRLLACWDAVIRTVALFFFWCARFVMVSTPEPCARAQTRLFCCLMYYMNTKSCFVLTGLSNLNLQGGPVQYCFQSCRASGCA